MQPLPRHRIAALATTALFASGWLASTVHAADTSSQQAPQAPVRLLGGVIGGVVGPLVGILDNVLTQTTAELQATLATLTPAEIGDLLIAASPAQLDKLLAAATPTQLSAALATLTPTETGDLLAGADVTQLNTLLGGLESGGLSEALGTLTSLQTGALLAAADSTQLETLLGSLTGGQLAGALATLGSGDLSDVVGALSPSQITSVLGAGGTASVIHGLLGTATALAGSTPDAAAVDDLVGQLGALLGGGLPSDAGQLGDLGALLTTVRSLLATAGLDTSLLSGLLTTANAILAGSPVGAATAPLQDVATQITVLLAPAGGTTGGGTTAGGTTAGGTTGGGTTKRPGTGTLPAAPQFTGYRASIGPIKLSRKRTSASFRLSCPAIAPKGCLVQVSGKVAGRRAMPALLTALPKGTSSPVTVKLAKSAARRLRTKGGSLRLSAQTALSSLPTATKTVKVKRPKKRR